jgi:putative membrane protein
MMGNWGGWSGFAMGGGWLIMILFWGVVILALAGAVRWFISGDAHGSSSAINFAIDTLKQRYARGEIGRDEYEQKKRDLTD